MKEDPLELMLEANKNLDNLHCDFFLYIVICRIG